MPPKVDATFYFHGNIDGKSLGELPIFAFHLGNGFSHGWDSGPVTNKGQFMTLAERVNPQVPVHIALPRIFANKHFQRGAEFSKLTLNAFKSSPNLGFMVGESIPIVFTNVVVNLVEPIRQWQGLPAPAPVQRNHFQGKHGMEFYHASNVTLLVYQADVA